MEIKLVKSMEVKADTLALFWYEGEETTSEYTCPAAEMVNYLITENEFAGKKDEICSAFLPKQDGASLKKILLVGLGKQENLTADILRQVIGKLIKKAKEIKVKELAVNKLPMIPDYSKEMMMSLIAETFGLACYKFEDFKTKKEEASLATIAVVNDDEDFAAAFAEGLLLAESTNFARELIGTPANVLTPAALAEQAVLKGKEYGFETEVLLEDEIIELGMEAFWQVAKGSSNPPRFIIMRHNGNPENPEDITALVGKGLCYDSGGLSLKSHQGMLTMKTDMAGSAAVIGAMCAIAKQNLPANVLGIIAACENIPSAHSYHPGDIIGSLGGKTIHIGSTDAEGRLTLIDAVYYAVTEEKASRVLDIATLTGSCITALGDKVSGVVANDDEFYHHFERASAKSGERIWRLPHFDFYKESIKHPEADLNNVGENGAGTITAALFIGEFVEGKPWIHVDIAGKSYTSKDYGAIAKGPTGVGVRSMYHLIKNLSE